MFSLYTVLLTLHILLVVLWVGAGVTVQVITRMATDNPNWPAIFYPFAEKWFPAVSGLTGLVGIGLWIDGPWGAGEPWIGIAVAGWLISSVVGATQLAPAVKRWSEGDVAARAKFVKVAQFDSLLLILIIADMVMKPGL
jgi:hypothetical protein